MLRGIFCTGEAQPSSAARSRSMSSALTQRSQIGAARRKSLTTPWHSAWRSPMRPWASRGGAFCAIACIQGLCDELRVGRPRLISEERVARLICKSQERKPRDAPSQRGGQALHRPLSPGEAARCGRAVPEPARECPRVWTGEPGKLPQCSIAAFDLSAGGVGSSVCRTVCVCIRCMPPMLTREGESNSGQGQRRCKCGLPRHDVCGDEFTDLLHLAGEPVLNHLAGRLPKSAR
jgi:hypothetical protein